MSKFEVTDFSGGLNTLMDERVIGPNAPGEAAESPYMENVEIVAKGAVITSPGFSQVSTGGTAGVGTLNLMAYEKDPSTRFLIIAQEDDYYSISPSSTTWSSIGDYGTDATNVGGVVYKGTTAVRRAILGNDNALNVLKQWDGTTFGNVAGTPPTQTWILETFMGRLFAAKGSTLYYTNIDNEGDWAGTISFDDTITSLKTQGEFLLVYTRRQGYTVQFYYNDSFTLSTPLKKPFQNVSGSLAHKTTVPVYNDTYTFSLDGVQRFGSDPEFIGNSLRVNSLSWKINPSIIGSSYNSAAVERACGIYFNKRYYLSLPYGVDTVNTRTFLYLYDYDAWTMRSGIYPSNYAIMANSSGMDELYFANNSTNQLCKFGTNWDYNSAGYNKVYKTKRWTMGNSMRPKTWKWVDIRGSMYTNTVLYVDIEVDGTTKTYRINSDSLETSSLGGYYGDENFGDIFYGGETSDLFKRMGARLYLPYNIRDGREMQITFRNSNAGEPWKIDYLGIEFEWDSDTKIPETYQSATIV